ncbi:MAG: hypothetical protein A2V46_10430 [Bacteroidetes bacterium RBG_19FT_COMBO_42_7]|nr:MAG: hypothetical protein A2Y71_05585 [Bacteroidetes bacterium RBG_13_42_15]OFY83560.1 MAG: hypothetical protein A2V46_10430 [Bacteroidetes bacterium RBG_19FT_COMBO_42_7]
MKIKLMILLILFISRISAGQTLNLHPDNHHYLTCKGHPVLLVTSAEHYGAVLNKDFDYITYLNTLESEGMNYTRIFTGSYVEIPGSFGIQNNSLAPATGSYLAPWKRVDESGLYKGEKKFNLNQWDPSYFERLHNFINEADKRGIIVEVTLFCSTYQDTFWERNPFNPGNNINGFTSVDRKRSNTLNNGPLTGFQKAFVSKVVAELNKYENIFYEIQNEPWADDPQKAMRLLKTHDPGRQGWANWAETASEASLEWQKEIASTIAETEKGLPEKHLIAQNYCNFKHSLDEVDPNVSILNFHYVWPETVWMNYGWDRPVNFDESGFAGSSDTTYLRQAWQFMAAGGAIFNSLDYSFYVGAETGNGINKAPGGGSSNLRKQLALMHTFLQSFDYIRMKPDFEVVFHSPGLEWQALSEKGRQYAIFFTGNGGGRVKLMLPQSQYRYKFISPYSGESLSEGILTGTGAVVELKLPLFSQMVALKIIVL